MSASGPKRTLAFALHMSNVPPALLARADDVIE
jgi:hypothetical protein